MSLTYIYNCPLGIDKDSFFSRSLSLRTRDTLCHSMREERRQILEIMLSRILKMCR